MQIRDQILDLWKQTVFKKEKSFFLFEQIEQYGTCSGKVVSCRSLSCSAYKNIILSERLRASSLNWALVSTSELNDMVICLLTRAKFYIGQNYTLYIKSVRVGFMNKVLTSLNWRKRRYNDAAAWERILLILLLQCCKSRRHKSVHNSVLSTSSPGNWSLFEKWDN